MNPGEGHTGTFILLTRKLSRFENFLKELWEWANLLHSFFFFIEVWLVSNAEHSGSTVTHIIKSILSDIDRILGLPSLYALCTPYHSKAVVLDLRRTPESLGEVYRILMLELCSRILTSLRYTCYLGSRTFKSFPDDLMPKPGSEPLF